MIGTMQERRYAALPVKERAVAEFIRRIKFKDWTFRTVQWDDVRRLPLPKQLATINSATICITDGVERFNERANTQTHENSVELAVEFAVPIGADEEASTVLNIIGAEIVDTLSGEHELFEEGTGDQTAILVYPREYMPDLDNYIPGGVASAIVMFELRYRHQRNRPFLPPALATTPQP